MASTNSNHGSTILWGCFAASGSPGKEYIKEMLKSDAWNKGWGKDLGILEEKLERAISGTEKLLQSKGWTVFKNGSVQSFDWRSVAAKKERDENNS